jgi:hypothetical protein
VIWLLAAAALLASNDGLEVSATCEPKVVERGALVTCSASLAQPKVFRWLERRASAEGHALVEKGGGYVAAGQPLTWAGPAVVDTKVAFVLESNGRRGSAQASFSVRKRAFPVFGPEPKADWQWAPDAALGGYPPPLADGAPLNGSMSRFELTMAGAKAELVAEGPNRQWYLVAAPPPKAKPVILVSRALRPGDPFHERQHAELTVPSDAQWPYCSKHDLELLRTGFIEAFGAGGRLDPAVTARLEAELEALHGWSPDYSPPKPTFPMALAARSKDLLARAVAEIQARSKPVAIPCRLRSE